MKTKPTPQTPQQRRPRPIDAPSAKAEASIFDAFVEEAAAIDQRSTPSPKSTPAPQKRTR